MTDRNLHHIPSVLKYALFICLFLSFAQLSAQRMEGMASFYADRFDGKKTSTGETFRQAGYSAASKDLAWGTIVEVTNISNGKTTQVRINDCGPHSKGRIIDLSKAAAQDLDFVKSGEAKVRLRIIQASEAGPTCSRGAWAKRLKAKGIPIPPPPGPWDPTKTVVVQSAPTPTIASGPPPTVVTADPIPEGELRGKASYYADRFQGRPTSTGEIYDRRKFTAASKDFPYGTRLEVMNIVNGKKVEVKVNDCGPNSEDRILDLSRAAAERIDIVQAGVAVVQVRILNLGTQGPTCNRNAWAKAQRAAAAGNAVPLNPAPATYQSTVPAPNLVDAHRVQVGAFGSSANAENLITGLKEKGFEDVYGEGDKGLTKVYVGMLSSEAAAKSLETDLRKSGYPKASVKSTRVVAEELRDPVTTYSSSVAEPKPAVQQFDPTDILFGVQIGAYSSQGNANKAIADLRENGFADVYSAKVGKMFRVFSGKYYFQNQAEDQKAKLRKAGYDGATVRRVQ